MLPNHNTHHITGDGSSTLCSAKFGVHYHSMHGAITESEHIYIGAGLKSVELQEISILEVGFGTGLNAALTAGYAFVSNKKISYTALELFPLSTEEFKRLNYADLLPEQSAILWKTVCEAEWNKKVRITDSFEIAKLHVDFTAWMPDRNFDLVYFDAFAPNDQPEMWEEKQFLKLYKSMNSNGILVTYCVKGIIKNALRNVGFTIERLPGPPGKNHMLRARKE